LFSISQWILPFDFAPFGSAQDRQDKAVKPKNDKRGRCVRIFSISVILRLDWCLMSLSNGRIQVSLK